MHDPWDVKSVRLGHQYQSCMKINGIPLLPPVLSKECRREMQYYKLLAKEVEKRISTLKPYIDTDTDSNEDKTDALDIPVCALPITNTTDSFHAHDKDKKLKSHSPSCVKYKSKIKDSPIVIDVNVKIKEKQTDVYCCPHRGSLHPKKEYEQPERDYDCCRKPEKEILTDIETMRKKTQKELIDDIMEFDFKSPMSANSFIHIPQDGPSSLSSKSFTGSLNDIHIESSNENQKPKLIRQSSYTLLQPSPQLLAHLEVESINAGIELSSFSMSESMCNLSYKKRKSWDLESAKVKWSTMALELKKKIVAKPNNGVFKNVTKKSQQNLQPVSRSQSVTPVRKTKISTRTPKSDPVQVRTNQNKTPTSPTDKNFNKEHTPSMDNKNMTRTLPQSNKAISPKTTASTTISNSEDPASRVKELYEKLQKQQVMQMATLMDKQKREQQLLQHVFEEQNNILLKQLKTVCPKASIEVKEAWVDLKDNTDRGPVSLSQLINNNSDQSMPSSPVSKTLTDTNNYLSKCDNVLRKCRDITNSMHIGTPKSRNENDVTNAHTARGHTQVSKIQDGNRTRTHSPNCRNTSRRLNYDSSSEIEPPLTDRTNDTMADLNVSFPSDNSEEALSYRPISVVNHTPNGARSKSPTQSRQSVGSNSYKIHSLEHNIHCSINSSKHSKLSVLNRQATSQERVAAEKIVACAKGFLVRRLMRTERVQSTVQTIKDALLCALQLHQDREGIRGADVDLHRRLIQQITAACYTLHDTFVTSAPTDRCALIAADRSRKQAIAAKVPTPRSSRRSDV